MWSWVRFRTLIDSIRGAAVPRRVKNLAPPCLGAARVDAVEDQDPQDQEKQDAYENRACPSRYGGGRAHRREGIIPLEEGYRRNDWCHRTITALPEKTFQLWAN